MNRQIALAASLAFSLGLACVASADADPPAAKKDQSKKSPTLDGVWVVKSMEQVGMKLEGEELPVRMRGMQRVFDKKRMTVKSGGREYQCTIAVNNDKTPKHLTVSLERGNRSRTLKCIYEIKGDTLRLAESGEERPTSFETDRSLRRVIVYTFTRQKKEAEKDKPKTKVEKKT